jgi:hypothetical protein
MFGYGHLQKFTNIKIFAQQTTNNVIPSITNSFVRWSGITKSPGGWIELTGFTPILFPQIFQHLPFFIKTNCVALKEILQKWITALNGYENRRGEGEGRMENGAAREATWPIERYNLGQKGEEGTKHK